MKKAEGKRELPKVDSATLAAILGLGKSHLYRLVGDGTIPREAKNEFDLMKAVSAYVDYVRRGSGAQETTHKARLSLAQAQTLAIEQRTRTRAGELVEIDEVRGVFSTVMITIAAQLDGIAGRCASELAAITDPAEVRAKLLEEVRRVRANAADELAALGHRGSRRRASSAATKA